MSYDYFIYLKHIENFSREDCEVFLRVRGLEVQLPVDLNPMTHSGFMGMGALLPETDASGEALRSGFEYDIDAYVYEPMPPRKPTLWERLRGIVPEAETDPYPGAVWEVLLSCHGVTTDVWAIPLALGFAAYVVSSCDGVLFDPQRGETFADLGAIEAELKRCIQEAAEV